MQLQVQLVEVMTHIDISWYNLCERLNQYGVIISVPTICRTLRQMSCTRQQCIALLCNNVSIRESGLWQKSPSMLVWLDETGCDNQNVQGRRHIQHQRNTYQLLRRGIQYSAIPIVSLEGVHDMHITEGIINSDKFADFICNCLLPCLNPFNGINARSVVIMDNASIHHIDEVKGLQGYAFCHHIHQI